MNKRLADNPILTKMRILYGREKILQQANEDDTNYKHATVNQV